MNVVSKTSNAGVRQAEAAVATARSQADAARSQIGAAQAERVAAEAEASRSGADVQRYQQLLKTSAVSRQQADNAVAAHRTANARLNAAIKSEQAAVAALRQAEGQVDEAEAKLTEARAAPEQIAYSRAQAQEAEAQMAQLESAVKLAELQLSYTKIYASTDGRVTRKSVEPGDYLEPGQRIFSLVPDEVWVIANFKETQLKTHQSGSARDGDVRRISEPDIPRTRREHPGRQRRRVQPAAAGERDGELREGRAARAGKDRHRRQARPGPRGARPRHVRRPNGQSSMTAAVAVPHWRPAYNPWLITVVVSMAAFMEVLDTSIANVALPHIAGATSASYDESTWVLTSYLVANAIVLPISGWLVSVFGRKRFFMTCIFLFSVSSFLCGIAPSLSLLLFFRVLQGAAGGGLQPMAQAILADTFPPETRGVAFSLYGITAVLAPLIGPTLGGWITDNYSWRWIFLINVPVGALALFLVFHVLEDPPYLQRLARGGVKLDYIGFALARARRRARCR